MTPSGRSRGKRQPTIIDVARAAGVSPTTVSNALNGRTNAMTGETLDRIQVAVESLRYRRSTVARGLVTRTTTTIGVILTEVETPFFLQALPHMEALARAAGHGLLLCVARNTDDERQAVELFLEKQADGIIFLSSSEYHDNAHLYEVQNTGVPLVLVNRADDFPEFAQINWDQTDGVAAAVGYLVGLGHRRIAHLVGPATRRSSVERLEGYRRGLAEHGIAYREEYVASGDFTASPDTWRDSVLQLLALPDRPTVVIASDDMVASIVLKTVQNAGLRVPQDISVVGIDDQPFCYYLNPSLTTLHLPTIAAGRRAVQMILDCLASESGQCSEHVLLPCSLIVRDSCAPPAALQGGSSG